MQDQIFHVLPNPNPRHRSRRAPAADRGELNCAARGRRRAPAAPAPGVGIEAHEISDPACDHDLGDPDGHRHPHGACAHRRYSELDFVEALRAKGLRETLVFRHVIKNAAPTALAVMGLQLGYMLGGSILIETVFSWPGSGLLAQFGDLPARSAAAAGHYPGAGAVLRGAQSPGRYRASLDRPAHQAELMQ